ncbi:class IV adenylate cyclase [soil metagenome]
MLTNLESKVRCNAGEMQSVREAATAAGLGPFASMTHRDTYFHAQHGRLKLREIRHDDGTELAELIGYSRADRAGARWSRYSRAEIPTASVEGLRNVLTSALGVLNVVEKVREVGIWRRTRIHLDQVKALGLFVELETVTGSATDPTARQELDEVARMLGLDQLETIPGSYADL